MTALVIDDARMIRLMLRKILTPLGYEVIEAENGLEGWNRLQELGSVDLILVDWNMPEMDGVDFVRTVRTDARYADLCIVMVTSQAEMEHVQTAIEAGISEYVMKPFTPEVIHDKLAMFGKC